MENKLKELRINNNKTQKEIAEYLKISQSNYSKYELGTIEPDIQSLILLSNYYKVSIDFLLNRLSNDNTNITQSKIIWLSSLSKLQQSLINSVLQFCLTFYQ